MRSDKYEIEEEKKKEEERQEEKQKKVSKIKKFLIIVFLILLCLFIYARFIEPNFIIIKEYKVEHSLINKDYDGFKIVHISDIRYGTTVNKERLNEIVKKANDLNPDIIVFTGNLFDKDTVLNEDNYHDIISSLSDLKPKLYKYAISSESDNENSNYYNVIDEADFILLDNKSKLLFYKSTTPIVIVGLNSTNPDYSILDNEEEQGYYKIVLTHEPDYIDNISNGNLILSGSIGGVINIVNPLFKEENNTKYFKEHYSFDDKELFVSNGLGTNKYKLRLNNIPSINLYRLYNK